MDDLVKRADEALKDVTPGAWETDERDHTEPYQAIRIGPSGNYRVCRVWLDDCAHDYNPEQRANARFIAAARELVPAMRARIEADAKRIAELEDSRNRLDDRIAELVEKNGQACVRAETAEDRAEAAEARVKELAAERDRLRLAVKLAKSTADEWAIARSTGNPTLEGDKADALWKAMRRLSAIADGPIQNAAALEGEKT